MIDEPVQENLFPIEDMQEPPQDVPVGQYPLTKQLAEVATGQPQSTESQQWNAIVDNAYTSVANTSNKQDMDIGEQLAREGNAPVFYNAMKNIAQRVALSEQNTRDNSQASREKLNEVARAAADTFATTSVAVILNNTPEKLAAVSEETAKQLAAHVQFEKTLSEAESKWGQGIVQEIMPQSALQGPLIAETARKFGARGATEQSMFEGRSNDLEALRVKYFSLATPEERIELAQNIFSDLSNAWSMSSWTAARYIREIVGPEAFVRDGVSDWLDRIGVAGTVVGGLGALSKAAKGIKAGNELRTLQRSIAAGGGKGVLQAADAANLVGKAAMGKYAGAAGTIVAEATGASAVIDLAKLVSATASKVLPEALTTASKELQGIITSKVEKVTQQLRDTIAVQGLKAADAEMALADIQNTFSRAIDNTIHSVQPFTISPDGLNVVGKVFRAPAGESAFLTKASAEAYVAAKGNPKNMRIVPDTTNTHFMVEENIVQDLRIRQAQLTAQIAETSVVGRVPAKGSTSPVKAGKGVGEGLGSPSDLKPPVAPPSPSFLRLTKLENEYAALLENSSVAGKGDVVKMRKELAALEKSKADYSPEAITALAKQLQRIEKLSFKDATKEATKRLTDKKLDIEASISSINKQLTDNASGSKVQNQLGELEKEMATLRKVVDKEIVGKPTSTLSTKESARSDGGVNKTVEGAHLTNETVDALFDNTEAVRIAGQGKTFGKVHPLVVELMQRLGARLGMENHPIVVYQRSDLKDTPHLKALGRYYDEGYGGSGAVHINTDRGSIIVMRANPTSEMMGEYMSTFAHEYAHAFEAVYNTKYSGILQSNFKKWLSSKGLKFDGNGVNLKVLDQFPIDALLEYRNVDSFVNLTSYVNKWFKGDEKAWLDVEPAMHSWASSYSEFFAENFSKWALTDEVPTTMLGELFTDITSKVKQIFVAVEDMVQRWGGKTISVRADKNTASLMKAHIELVDREGQAKKLSNIVSQIVSESKTIPKEIEVLSAELKSVEERLAAIDAATGGAKSGWLVEEDIRKPLTYATLAKYTDEDVQSASRVAGVTSDWALSTSSQLYAERVVGVNQQSRYNKLLTEFVRPSIEKLSAPERAALDNTLVLGDKNGVVFKEHELMGMELSVRTREAYYHVRTLRDIMYHMRNDTAIKSLSRQGYSRITHPLLTLDKDAGDLFAKEVVVSKGTSIYNVRTSAIEAADPEALSSAGMRVYELNTPRTIGGKSRKTIAVPIEGSDTHTISEVIPYRAGEYRRVYSDEYFVKLAGVEDVEGVAQATSKAHRTARTAKEAERYVSSFNEAAALHKAGKLSDVEAARLLHPYGWKTDEFKATIDTSKDVKAQYVFNRTEDDFTSNTMSINSSYASKRGEHLPDVFGETSLNTLSPLDSIASEISNTAYVASVSEWRESNIIRWFNTFQEILPAHMQKMEPADAFAAMFKEEAYVGQTKEGYVAKQVHKYIVSQLNVTSQEERSHVGMMRMASEWAEGVADGTKGAGAMHKVGMFMRTSADYPKWLRTVAFHSFFSFNPIQVFVQGMNAFNAIAISPLHGLAAGKAMPLYRLAAMSDREEVWRKWAKTHNVVSLGMGNEDEFVETIRAIQRTGLLDGINSASMYGAETGKYGLFNGITRKIANAGALPFNEGETASRLVSFDIAKREFISNNKGVAWWTDENLAKILERQDDLTQNMTSANMASWQKGWVSIPTQFIQYQVKLMMNMLSGITGNPRAFSRKEAVQLMVAHGLMMGTAGFALWPSREMVGKAVNEDNMTPEQRLYLQQGVISGLIGSLSDGEVKLGIGARFNTFKWYEDIIGGVLDPEKGFLEVLAGASGGSLTKIFAGAGNAIALTVGTPLTQASLKEGLTEIATSVSAINNVHKSVMALQNYNTVMSKNKGTAMYKVTDTEAYLLALGLPPAKATDFETAYKTKKAYDQGMKDAATEIAKRRMMGMQALRNGDVSSYDVHQAVISNILSTYTGSEWRRLLGEAAKVNTETQYRKMLMESWLKGTPQGDVVVNSQIDKE
jgi:1,2-phenylacetyl-CoA epoxidase PaaB subunit